jgi:HD-GYP domain-containing protein (c-di-GMP phosphodiesterase class II)/pSer/pThr/pTyr-binding forkhead associated (FHA) protein
MSTPRIILSLAADSTSAHTWTSNCHLRIGRLAELEVTIDDMSVSRLHAEIYLADEGWLLRDRGSSNGTLLNGTRIGRTPQPVQQGDLIQAGTVLFKVEELALRPVVVRVGQQTVQVEASRSALRNLGLPSEAAANTTHPEEPAFHKLLHRAHRLAHPAQGDKELKELLAAAVAYFRARRGGLFLVNEATGQLVVQCHTSRAGLPPLRAPGKTLATLAFRSQQSLLFRDQAEAAKHQAESAVNGEMHSIVCGILRVPDRVFGVLHLDRGPDDPLFTESDLTIVDTFVAVMSLGLDRRELVSRHETLWLQTITTLAQAIEMRDPYTGNHTQRVTTYALILAEEIGMSDEERRRLKIATLLHDIGKIAIDDHILRKPGRLAPDEFTLMKSHVMRGWEIVQMIPGLGWALPVVRGHHERWDGRGYPDGLKGEEIPLTARVVAVADAFDAMTSDRPYRLGMPAERGFAELQAGAGTHFDPACVEAFFRVRPKIEAILAKEAAERIAAATGTNTISRQELERERKIDRYAKPQEPPPTGPPRTKIHVTAPG